MSESVPEHDVNSNNMSANLTSRSDFGILGSLVTDLLMSVIAYPNYPSAKPHVDN